LSHDVRRAARPVIVATRISSIQNGLDCIGAGVHADRKPVADSVGEGIRLRDAARARRRRVLVGHHRVLALLAGMRDRATGTLGRWSR
jgi:hypothetical protein